MQAESPDIDHDCQPMRAALARLCRVLAGQLDQAADGLDQGRCGAWPACAFAGRLDRLRVDVGYLLKDVARLQPVETDDPTPAPF